MVACIAAALLLKNAMACRPRFAFQRTAPPYPEVTDVTT